MSVEQHGPDWTTIGGVTTAILGAIGTAFAAWKTWGKEKTDARRDSMSLTLDGVFKLVNELQDEVVRKATEIAAVEQRCNEHKQRLEDRIVILEAALAAQIKANEELRREIRELKQGV